MELPGHPDLESRSLGHIRWYDAMRKTGVIDCPHTTSLRIQCDDDAEAPPALPINQLVTFVIRHNEQGPYATSVRPIKRVPPDVEPRLLAQVAATLHERGRQPLAQIQHLITALGPESILALVEETLRIEAAGGYCCPMARAGAPLVASSFGLPTMRSRTTSAPGSFRGGSGQRRGRPPRRRLLRRPLRRRQPWPGTRDYPLWRQDVLRQERQRR